jgi:hypothetical protein
LTSTLGSTNPHHCMLGWSDPLKVEAKMVSNIVRDRKLSEGN